MSQIDKLHTLSLRDAAQRIRDGELTSAELTRACLTRCSRLEARIQAWEHLAAGRAMDQAEERDAALKAGGAVGPLHGVPLGIKDIIDVAGMPTTMGSPVYAGHTAGASAAVVHALEAAGAVILGKTVTTEFAYYTPNKTRNPWNPEHTPGGSSMGSAAAVAAGMACGALGTQTNGSVIRPAAFCGVVGFKPSLGASPVDRILVFAPTFDTVGVFTRSVRRCGAPRVRHRGTATRHFRTRRLHCRRRHGSPRCAPRYGKPRMTRSAARSRQAWRRYAAPGRASRKRSCPAQFEQGHDAHRCDHGLRRSRQHRADAA